MHSRFLMPKPAPVWGAHWFFEGPGRLGGLRGPGLSGVGEGTRCKRLLAVGCFLAKCHNPIDIEIAGQMDSWHSWYIHGVRFASSLQEEGRRKDDQSCKSLSSRCGSKASGTSEAAAKLGGLMAKYVPKMTQSEGDGNHPAVWGAHVNVKANVNGAWKRPANDANGCQCVVILTGYKICWTYCQLLHSRYLVDN